MRNKNDQTDETDEPQDDAEYGDTGGPVSAIDPEEIVAHDERQRALQLELEDMKAKYARALADFQNYQRRSLENEKEARRQGVTSAVSNLLGVLDNFDLALKQDPAKVSAEQIMQGVAMVRSMLAQALGAVGVTTIEPRPGDEFDPRREEAVAQVPSDDIEPGRVAAVLQAGYALGDRVLRPAKVSVAKAPQD